MKAEACRCCRSTQYRRSTRKRRHKASWDRHGTQRTTSPSDGEYDSRCTLSSPLFILVAPHFSCGRASLTLTGPRRAAAGRCRAVGALSAPCCFRRSCLLVLYSRAAAFLSVLVSAAFGRLCLLVPSSSVHAFAVSVCTLGPRRGDALRL